MADAARVMRGLIIDHARRRQARKRGGGLELTSLDDRGRRPTGRREGADPPGAALDELLAVEPVLAEVVDLKFFRGFILFEITDTERVDGTHLWERQCRGPYLTFTARCG